MLVRLELSLPRDARYVGMMRQVAGCLLADVGAPEDATADIQLALSEACGNVVRHAEGVAGYSVCLAVSADAVEIEIIDEGPGFSPPDEAQHPGPEAESGRGLALIDALVDDCHFERDGDDHRVCLVKRFDGVRLPDLAAAGADGEG